MIERYLDERFNTDPGPAVTVLRERQIKARVNHICDCCGGGIRRGEKHVYFVYLDDEITDRTKAFRTSRVHIYCPPEID